jgi:hypothetical protein
MEALTMVEVRDRVERQRVMRDAPTDPTPDPLPLLMREIARQAKPFSTWDFECVCHCPISTRVPVGTCPSCARQFDVRMS